MAAVAKMKNSTLVQIAAGTFLVGATGLYLAQKHMQGKVRKLPHYRESLTIVADHTKARETLGPPIQLGQVDLADRHRNYVDKQTSQLRIPVTGSLDCGFLDVYAVRANPQAEFKASKMPHIVITAHKLSDKGCCISKEGLDFDLPLSEEHILYCKKHSPMSCLCSKFHSKLNPLCVANALEKYGWKVVTAYSYAVDNQKHAWIMYKED